MTDQLNLLHLVQLTLLQLVIFTISSNDDVGGVMSLVLDQLIFDIHPSQNNVPPLTQKQLDNVKSSVLSNQIHI